MAQGDILTVCPDDELWPNIRLVVREGSPPRTEVMFGIEFQVSDGDGEIIGYYSIERNWGNPEVRPL